MFVHYRDTFDVILRQEGWRPAIGYCLRVRGTTTLITVGGQVMVSTDEKAVREYKTAAQERGYSLEVVGEPILCHSEKAACFLLKDFSKKSDSNMKVLSRPLHTSNELKEMSEHLK